MTCGVQCICYEVAGVWVVECGVGGGGILDKQKGARRNEHRAWLGLTKNEVSDVRGSYSAVNVNRGVKA